MSAPAGSEEQQPDTFWAAASQIVREVHAVLRPGAVAVWVLKAFVRDGQIVPFPQQWCDMCEAQGFEPVEWIRAHLVEDRGAQHTLDGGLEERRVERKSFFRRLAEKKGAPRIDWEVVLIMRKDGTGSGMAALVTSPPYAAQLSRDPAMPERDRQHLIEIGADPNRAGSDYSRSYGHTPGQLGQMREGEAP